MRLLEAVALIPDALATGFAVNLVSYAGTAWSESLVATAAPSATGVTIPVTEGVPSVYLIRGQTASGITTTQSFVYGEVLCLGYLRARIREELSDIPTIAKNRWTDEEINGYIRDAVRDYSKHFPRQAEVDVPTVAGQQSYLLPPDMIEDKIVLVRFQRFLDADGWRDEYFLKKKPYVGGESPPQIRLAYAKLSLGIVRRQARLYAGHYSVFDGHLLVDMLPMGDENMHVTYGAMHPMPYSDADMLTIVYDDLELLMLYAEAKCAKRVEAQDALLSRWNKQDTGGSRNDSPIAPWSTRLFNAYKSKVDEKMNATPQSFRLGRV